MSAPYILRRDGHDYQAQDLETLRAWAKAGRVLPADLVYSPQHQSWYRASDLRGLRDVLPPSASGPPPVAAQSVQQCFWLRKNDQNYAAESLEVILQWAAEGMIQPEDYIFHPAYGKWFQAGDSPQLVNRFPPHIKHSPPFLPASADPMASAEARVSAEVPRVSPAPKAVVEPARSPSVESADSTAKTVMDMQAIRVDMLRPAAAAARPVEETAAASPAPARSGGIEPLAGAVGEPTKPSSGGWQSPSGGLFGAQRSAISGGGKAVEAGGARPDDPGQPARPGQAPGAAVLRKSGAHSIVDANALREAERRQTQPLAGPRVAQPISGPGQSVEVVAEGTSRGNAASPEEGELAPTAELAQVLPAVSAARAVAAQPAASQPRAVVAPAEAQPRVAVAMEAVAPVEARAPVTAPVEARAQVAAPVEARAPVAVPVEAKPQAAVPVEPRSQVAVPIEAKPQAFAQRPVVQEPVRPAGSAPAARPAEPVGAAKPAPVKPPPLPAAALAAQHPAPAPRPAPPPLPAAASAPVSAAPVSVAPVSVAPASAAPVAPRAAASPEPAPAVAATEPAPQAPASPAAPTLPEGADAEVKFNDRLGLMKLYYDIAKVFVYTRDMRPGEMLESSCTLGQGGEDFLGTAKRAIYHRLAAALEAHLDGAVRGARGELALDELPGYELMVQRAQLLLASMRKAEPVIGAKPPDRFVIGNTGRPKMSAEEEAAIVEIDATLKRLISVRAKAAAGRAA